MSLHDNICRGMELMVSHGRMKRMVALCVVLLPLSAGIFCALEDWAFVDSLYFCMITG